MNYDSYYNEPEDFEYECPVCGKPQDKRTPCSNACLDADMM